MGASGRDDPDWSPCRLIPLTGASPGRQVTRLHQRRGPRTEAGCIWTSRWRGGRHHLWRQRSDGQLGANNFGFHGRGCGCGSRFAHRIHRFSRSKPRSGFMIPRETTPFRRKDLHPAPTRHFLRCKHLLSVAARLARIPQRIQVARRTRFRQERSSCAGGFDPRTTSRATIKRWFSRRSLPDKPAAPGWRHWTGAHLREEL